MKLTFLLALVASVSAVRVTELPPPPPARTMPRCTANADIDKGHFRTPTGKRDKRYLAKNGPAIYSTAANKKGTNCDDSLAE